MQIATLGVREVLPGIGPFEVHWVDFPMAPDSGADDRVFRNGLGDRRPDGASGVGPVQGIERSGGQRPQATRDALVSEDRQRHRDQQSHRAEANEHSWSQQV